MVKTIGYIILVISCISYLMILVIPWLGFSKIQIAGIMTGLIIVGETSFYISLLILGRSFYNKIKSKLKFWKTKSKDQDPPAQNDLTDPN
jgi:hypothetical protein